MKKLLISFIALFLGLCAFAQSEQSVIRWTSSVKHIEGKVYEVTFTGRIPIGYHSYSLKDEVSPTEIFDAEVQGGELVGPVKEVGKAIEKDGALIFENKIVLTQRVKLTSKTATYIGSIYTNACKSGQCISEYYDFTVEIRAGK